MQNVKLYFDDNDFEDILQPYFNDASRILSWCMDLSDNNLGFFQKISEVPVDETLKIFCKVRFIVLKKNVNKF